MNLCSHLCETHVFMNNKGLNYATASFLPSKAAKSAYRDTAQKSSGIPPAGTSIPLAGNYRKSS